LTFQWTHYPWEDPSLSPAAKPLVANDIFQSQVAPRKHPATVEGLVDYADSAYLSCRILMISSTLVHNEALYCAAQTFEKYMKAILLQRNQNIRPYKHDLVKLANALGDEFSDPEFLQVCERLSPFEEAGRYPDHLVDRWSYPIEFLAFLDSFVAHCRDLLRLPAGTRTAIASLLAQDPQGNPVMRAAITAIRDKNHFLSQLQQ
jgi:HEPN domain-containing protein